MEVKGTVLFLIDLLIPLLEFYFYLTVKLCSNLRLCIEKSLLEKQKFQQKIILC